MRERAVMFLFKAAWVWESADGGTFCWREFNRPRFWQGVPWRSGLV